MLYGGNPYRAKAYLRAADSVALLTEPIGELIAQNRLREIPGVGEAIAGVITTLFQTGTHPSLEKMRADVPDSVLEMLTIPGLRPEKVLKLHKELGIDTIDELEAAAKQDRLKSVKGLGPALQRKILAGLGGKAKLTRCKAHPSRRRASSDSQSKFRKFKLRFEIYMVAGDLRRGSELVSDLALVAEKQVPETSQLRFGELTVHVANQDRLGAALLFATGSESHLDQLQTLRRKKG